MLSLRFGCGWLRFGFALGTFYVLGAQLGYTWQRSRFGCIGSGLFRYWLCFGCVLVVFGYGWLPLVVFGYKHAIGYVLASFWLHSVTLGYGLFTLWLWLQGYIFWLRCGYTLSLFRSIPLQTLGYIWVTFGLRSVAVGYRWVAVWLHFSYVLFAFGYGWSRLGYALGMSWLRFGYVKVTF